MNTTYDTQNDIKYVRLGEGVVDHTKAEKNWLLFDCTQNGKVIGIEILNASLHPNEREILQEYALLNDK